MDQSDEDSEEGGVFEELMESKAESLSESQREKMAEMYRVVVTGDRSWRQVLENNAELLDAQITIEHTDNCNCGRFFEQHPTTVDGIEGQALTSMLVQIRTGFCSCYRTNNSPNRAASPAAKSLMHAAAAAGYQSPDVVRYLMDKGCDVNKMTVICSYTPLFRAVCSKNLSVIEALLSHPRIQVNLRSRKEQYAPLMEAILNRLTQVVGVLLLCPTIDLAVRNFRQETPVIVAARMGETEILEQLLKAGADPDSRDYHDLSALMFAVTYDLKDVTKLLLDYGASLHQRTSFGETPLLNAISSESYDAAQVLLEAGADVNDRSPDSYSALMMATYSGDAFLVQALLKHGADVHYSNDTGYQALHLAAWNGYQRLVKLFLTAGALPDVQTLDCNTPLTLAAHGNHPAVVETLVELGCDVLNADKDRDTALHYAAFNGCLPVVERLLDKGADPGALNRLNVSPLWNAVYKRHLDVAKLLIKRNVDVSTASQGIEQHAQSDSVVTVFDTPRSPLYVAAHVGDAALALLLITAGCTVGSETWIAQGQFPGASEHDENLQEMLSFYQSQPLPLTFQCRVILRRLAGSNVRRFVRRLVIPEKFKHFISLRDVLD